VSNDNSKKEIHVIAWITEVETIIMQTWGCVWLNNHSVQSLFVCPYPRNDPFSVGWDVEPYSFTLAWAVA